MDRREDFSKILKEILGTNNVYYAAKNNKDMTYPCIRYSLDEEDDNYANNKKYIKNKRWEVILIGSPSELLPLYEKLNDLNYSTYIRSYDSDNLRHYIFAIYY